MTADAIMRRMQSDLLDYVSAVCRSAQYAELGDDLDAALVYREAVTDLVDLVVHVKQSIQDVQALIGHRHEYGETDYCIHCGADGRA